MSKSTISLEDSVPSSFLQSKTNLLFVTDNYRDIINNYRIFTMRAAFTSHDLILDLNGNVIHLTQYK